MNSNEARCVNLLSCANPVQLSILKECSAFAQGLIPVGCDHERGRALGLEGCGALLAAIDCWYDARLIVSLVVSTSSATHQHRSIPSKVMVPYIAFQRFTVLPGPARRYT